MGKPKQPARHDVRPSIMEEDQTSGRPIPPHGSGDSCVPPRQLLGKMLFAEPREKPKSLQLVLDGILQFGEAQFDTRRPQDAIKFGQNVGRGDVDAGHRLRCDNKPARRRRRRRHRIEDPILEQFGVGKK